MIRSILFWLDEFEETMNSGFPLGCGAGCLTILVVLILGFVLGLHLRRAIDWILL
jgi:hypothetical protein